MARRNPIGLRRGLVWLSQPLLQALVAFMVCLHYGPTFRQPVLFDDQQNMQVMIGLPILDGLFVGEYRIFWRVSHFAFPF